MAISVVWLYCLLFLSTFRSSLNCFLVKSYCNCDCVGIFPGLSGVLVRVLQRTHNWNGVRVCVHVCVYHRNWLTWLLSPKRPMICHLEAGGPGKLAVEFSENQECPWQGQRRNISAQAERTHSLFLCLFVLCGLSKDWVMPITWGGQIFFTQPTDPKVNPFRKQPQTHPEITFYQVFGCPLVQLSWHMKWTITSSIPLERICVCFCRVPGALPIQEHFKLMAWHFSDHKASGNLDLKSKFLYEGLFVIIKSQENIILPLLRAKTKI